MYPICFVTQYDHSHSFWRTPGKRGVQCSCTYPPDARGENQILPPDQAAMWAGYQVRQIHMGYHRAPRMPHHWSSRKTTSLRGRGCSELCVLRLALPASSMRSGVVSRRCFSLHPRCRLLLAVGGPRVELKGRVGGGENTRQGCAGLVVLRTWYRGASSWQVPFCVPKNNLGVSRSRIEAQLRANETPGGPPWPCLTLQWNDSECVRKPIRYIRGHRSLAG